MKKLYLFGILSLSLIATVYAADPTFTPEQVGQIEKIVHNYVVNNPQVLMEAAEKLQQKALADEKSKLLAEVPKYSKEIFAASPANIVAGNPKGSVIMAEFSSYQCGHCRAMNSVVDKLMKENADLQVIFVNWPIFGNEAVNAAKMALAANKQNKYYALHSAFMQSQESLRPEVADKIATTTGLDLKKLKADMNDGVVDAALKNNFQLAEKLKLHGTPTFIFANQSLTKFSIVPGQASEEEMIKAINEVR